MLQLLDGQKSIEVREYSGSKKMIKVFKWPIHSNGHHTFHETT